MTRQRGDTLIEVILAVSIFSLVAVGAMTMMNSGVAMAQRSLEITLVRQQIDTQADLLRFVHDRAHEDVSGAYATLWNSLSAKAVANPQQLLNLDSCPSSITNGFALVASGGSIKQATGYSGSPATYARTEGSASQGISVQLSKVEGGRAYDAYIQACWSGPGSSRAMTTGTIVRMYDPGV